MNARRSRNDPKQRLADFRWWGCVLLAMFAVIQTARGSAESALRSKPVASDSTPLVLAHAAISPAPHVVTLNAMIPLAAGEHARRNAYAGDLRTQTR
jgi:hypothetical protein